MKAWVKSIGDLRLGWNYQMMVQPTKRDTSAIKHGCKFQTYGFEIELYGIGRYFSR